MTATLPERPSERPSGGRSAGPSGGWTHRLARSAYDLPLWARVTGVYVVLRFVTGILMSQAADEAGFYPGVQPGVQGPTEGDLTLSLNWDARWYGEVYQNGYPDEIPVVDGRTAENAWAFYPAFPYAVRLVAWLLGSDFATVAPLLALLAGLGAAVVMARLLVETLPATEHPRRVETLALCVVAVWAACPVSPVLQMAYTESFSMLLLVAFLLLLVRERWWLAGACALALGLTRPIALPLIVVLVVGLWMRWRERATRPVPQREAVGMVWAFGAVGLSGILWTAIAAVATGRRDAYPATMTAWRGDDSIQFLEPWKRTVTLAWDTHDRLWVLPALGIAVPLVLSLLMLVPRIGGGLDLRLRVWSVAYSLYLLAVVDGHTSIFRYLVPLFPLAVLLVGAHRRAPRWWETRALFWVGAGIIGQVGWIWWLVVFSPLPGGGDYPP
jgi:hypothetical protein